MALYRRPDRIGGIFWCKFKHRGRVHYHSTEIRDDNTAESKRAARDAEIEYKARVTAESGQGGKGYAEEACLGDLEQLDLDRVDHKDEHAKADIKYFWKHLFRHLGGEYRFASTLTLACVAKFEMGRTRDGATPQTWIRERQTLVRGLKLAVIEGLLDRMPFDPFLLQKIKKKPKHKQRKGVLHSEERIAEVLMCMSIKAVDAGHREICRFVQLTGLRSSELQRAADFHVVPTTWGAIMTVDSAKDGESREVPLTHEAYAIWKRWKHRFAIADIAHSLTRASRAAGGGRGVTLRDLRKFYISMIAKKDPAAAQRLAGHTNIKTTGIYIEASQDAAVAAHLASFQPAYYEEAIIDELELEEGGGVTEGVTVNELSRRGLRDSNPRPSDSKSSRSKKIKDLA